MFNRPLLRALAPAALAAFALPAGTAGQMHRVTEPERVTRAVGVYEWTGNLNKPLAARLVPVSLFISGHLEDAGVYLPRPMPFALQSGYVYSIEKAGASEGLLEVQQASDVVTQHAKADDDPMGTWYGYGTFHPPAIEKRAAPLHASAHPSAVVASNDDDDKPHFVTRPSAASDSPSTPASTPSTSGPSAPSGADRTGTPASTGTNPAGADPDNDRPTLRRRDSSAPAKGRKRGGDSGVLGTGKSLNDDPDRPTLHRGELEGESSAPPLLGLPADLHQSIAVSDAANRDTHIFARAWESSAEQAGTLADMQKLALKQIAEYMKVNQLLPGVARATPVAAASGRSSVAATGTATGPAANGAETPGGPPRLQRGVPKNYGSQTPPGAQPAASGQPNAGSKTSAEAQPSGGSRTAVSPHTTSSARGRSKLRSKPTAATPISLAGEQLTPLTLSYGGLPTFVYTAESPVSSGGFVYVTTVAQRLPSGELQVSLRSVTDANHLNRVPWMRFIDAVDPDASHRASLLFELRAQTGRQFALYSLVSANAEQTLATGPIE